MTPLDRLAYLIKAKCIAFSDTSLALVSAPIELIYALIDVAREARAVAKYATPSIVDLDDALTALDSAIMKALGDTE